ncbi:MAG: prepilin-type N-terminal cleavage/methylation domain-containing protein [Candidatus Methylomirabilales bacterium]
MNNARGFSVIEVLIGATILTVALLAIASMFPTAYSNVGRSGEQTVAVTLAQQRIEELKNQAYTALAAGQTTEALTGEYAGYTRKTTIEDNVPTQGVKRVTVEVTTPFGRPVELKSLIAK